MTPTRAEVLAATGDALDRMVAEVILQQRPRIRTIATNDGGESCCMSDADGLDVRGWLQKKHAAGLFLDYEIMQYEQFPQYSRGQGWDDIKAKLAARDLCPAFARELAQLVIPNNKAIRRAFSECQTGFTYSDAQLWAMLSADPTAVCRAAVLACLQGEE